MLALAPFFWFMGASHMNHVSALFFVSTFLYLLVLWEGRGSPALLFGAGLAVGAAVLPADRRVYKVRDSKMLTEEEREALFERVAEWCRAWAVGTASPAAMASPCASEVSDSRMPRAESGTSART